jgi:succinate dehydrogenase / fumarate reductase cytochrome b subunit
MERPLSPYMFPTWYRFQITSVLSILHRFTGIALALGSILLAWSRWPPAATCLQ